MAPTQLLLLLLLLLAAVSSPTTAVTTETFLAATQTLANSDHLAMSLTLQLLSVNSSILVEAPTLTLFCPSDEAFQRSGQPSISRLLYQFSPIQYPLASLYSLPLGSKIPTLLPNHSLVITSNTNSLNNDTSPSINGVKINQEPIFDSGSLLILGVDKFFDMGFEASGQGRTPAQCGFNISRAGHYSFSGASRELRWNGYGIVASFLDLQLPVTFKDGTGFTIFAPADRAAKREEFKDYPAFILRHIVPCRYPWNELVNFDDGFVMETLLEGYKVGVKKAGGGAMFLNGVGVSHPNLYRNEWLVVHGLDGLFVEPKTRNGAPVSVGKHRFLIVAGSFLLDVISSLFLYLV